ncbi:MAG: hypothetical protein AAF367_12060 [Pseudomonadota bacterium]
MESALQTVNTMHRAGEAAKARLLRDLNLRVRVDLRPTEFLETISRTSKKGILPEMSADAGPISPKESAYIVLEDEDGVVAATVAARVFNCYRNGFTRMLSNLYSTHYANGADAFNTRDIPPVFSEISGLACYVGEFHFEPQWRRKIDISDLSAIAYCEAYRRFLPDWYFGFTRAKHARAGLAARYFGSRTFPNALQWEVQNPVRWNSDWFVCSTIGEIEFAMRRYFLDTNVDAPLPTPTLEAALPTSS